MILAGLVFGIPQAEVQLLQIGKKARERKHSVEVVMTVDLVVRAFAFVANQPFTPLLRDFGEAEHAVGGAPKRMKDLFAVRIERDALRTAILGEELARLFAIPILGDV